MLPTPWVHVSRQDEWDEMFQNVKKAQTKYGKYPDKKDCSQLFRWGDRQRRRYFGTEVARALTPHETESLASIGFITKWDATQPKPQQANARAENQFDDNIAAVDLAQKAGEFHFAQRSTALAKWVNGIRQRKQRELLSEERIRKLDRVGFCWTVESATKRLNAFRKAL